VRKMQWMVLALVALNGWAAAQAVPGKPYDQLMDIPFGEAKGQTLTLDVYKPNGTNRHSYLQPNDNGKGLALIDVISGGWNSRRGRQEEHEAASVFNIFCAHGYTVFAVRPGSLPDFTGLEMVENLKQGIRWVKANADQYGVDPDRIGMFGASAGAHLASLAAILADPADPASADPLRKRGTEVQAMTLFFPPTDFLDWNGQLGPFEREPYLLFSDGLEGKSNEQIQDIAGKLSPARQVKAGLPPIYLVHGDIDPVVPVQQAHNFEKALKEKGNEVELFIKQGGGHFWLTIPQEILSASDFFHRKLSAAASEKTAAKAP
jgi:acetyl esterase/lipase